MEEFQHMTSLLAKINLFVLRLRDEERGQDLIEYALFGGLIALGMIAVGFAAYQGILTDLTDGIGNCVDFDSTTGCTPF
jgi:Flp pilus assembly pilin Flp